MENLKLEEKEIYEVDSKKYTVITRVSENCLGKESLKKLICNYAMRELQDYEKAIHSIYTPVTAFVTHLPATSRNSNHSQSEIR